MLSSPNNVGSCYAQGQRVLSDYVTATLALCVKEAAKGSRQGLRGAAFCLSSNVDSDDGGKAVSDVVALLMLVAEGEGGADFAVALYRLGCCIRDGIGCDADAAVAGTCFEGAAARGYARANVALLALLSDGPIPESSLPPTSPLVSKYEYSPMPPPLHFHELSTPNDTNQDSVYFSPNLSMSGPKRERVHIPSPPPSPPSSSPPPSLTFPIITPSPSPWRPRSVQLPDIDDPTTTHDASTAAAPLHSSGDFDFRLYKSAGDATASATSTRVGGALSPRSRRVSFGDVSVRYLYEEDEYASPAAAEEELHEELPNPPRLEDPAKAAHAQQAVVERGTEPAATVGRRWFACSCW